MKHRPELDGLRGIAFSSCWGRTRCPGFADGGGGAGVTLFFVLSGYLITSLLLAEKAKTDGSTCRLLHPAGAPAVPALAARCRGHVSRGRRSDAAGGKEGVDYRVVVLA